MLQSVDECQAGNIGRGWARRIESRGVEWACYAQAPYESRAMGTSIRIESTALR